MTIDPRAVYETTWWERVGLTDWIQTPSGGRHRTTIFRCIATGEQKLAGELPIGALYALDREACTDLNGFPPAAPHDGLSIACVCLGRSDPERRHHWYIDYRASNCTMPEDKNHRCWVRHGTVGDRLTVDKEGLTCKAGAGSFFMGPNDEWHGFLKNGKLTP